MPSEETVISELRAVLLSSKNPLHIQDVISDYEALNGYSIPFRDFGYNKVEDFLRKLKDDGEITVEYKSGNLMVHAIPREASAHVTHLISKQKKTTKKRKYTSDLRKFSIGAHQNMSDFSPAPLDSPFHLSSLDCLQDETLSGEDPVPFNLLQDSCSLKLGPLLSPHRNILENLVSKINYQINYFSVSKKMKSSEVLLICKVCHQTIPIPKVEEHAFSQEHLHNLTRPCNSASLTSATAVIIGNNSDVSDSEESSQRCSLCNINVSESGNAWNEHVQSEVHRSKLKAIKPEIPLKPVSIFSSTLGSKNNSIDANNLKKTRKKVKNAEPNSILFSSAEKKLNEKSFSDIIQVLNDRDKKNLEVVKRKLNDNIHYFKPSYKKKYDKLYVKCKLCKVTLLPKNVGRHASSGLHLCELKKKLRVLKSMPAEKSIDSAESFVLPSSIQFSKSSLNIACQYLNDEDKKLLKNVELELKDSRNYFELSYRKESDKLFLLCKPCKWFLPLESVRPHVLTSEHLKNCKKKSKVIGSADAQNCDDSSFSVISHFLKKEDSEALEALKCELKDSINDFEPSYNKKKKKLRLACKLCDLTLGYKEVIPHISSTRHSKNLKRNLAVAGTAPTQMHAGSAKISSAQIELNMNSLSTITQFLSNEDKRALEAVKCELKGRINDFEPSYKQKKKKLYLACKLCDFLLCLKEVIPHISTARHLKNLRRNVPDVEIAPTQNHVDRAQASSAQIELNMNSLSTITQFLSNEDKRALEAVKSELKDRINYFEPSYNRKKKKLRLACKLCDLTLGCKEVLPHVSGAKHLKNLRRNVPVVEITPTQNHVDSAKASSARIEVNMNSFSTITQFLSNEDKKALEGVKCELKNKINQFEPYYDNTLCKLFLFCKVCKLYLLPKFVKVHVSTDGHLYYSEQNLPAIQFTPAQNCDDNTKPSVPPSPGQTELNQKSSEVTDSVNDEAKKVVQDLTNKLKDYMNYFDPSYENGSNKLCYTCNICHISFPSENAKLHIYRDLHLTNLRSSLSLAKLEALDAEKKRILKNIPCQLYKELFFFQLIYDNDFNKLYFACKVCTVVLVYDDVESHVSSLEHTQNLAANPIVLDFNSLNDCNKQIVEDLTMNIRMHDFILVYRIGTEQLRFYCTYCNSAVSPQNVEVHSQSSDHLKAVSTENRGSYNTVDESNSQRKIHESDVQNNNVTTTFSNTHIKTSSPDHAWNKLAVLPKIAVNNANENLLVVKNSPEQRCIDDAELHVNPTSVQLSENSLRIVSQFLDKNDKKLLEAVTPELEGCMNYFKLSQKKESDKLYLVCKVCDFVYLPLESVGLHFSSNEHLRNLEKNLPVVESSDAQNYDDSSFSIITHFLKKEDSEALEALKCELKDSINDFEPSYNKKKKKLRLACKLCDLTLGYKEVLSHVSSAIHLKNLKRNVETAQTQNHVDSAKAPSAQIELNINSFSTITQFLNNEDKIALEAVKFELKDNINHFEPFYANISRKLYLFCKVCKLYLLPKFVKAHVSTDAHLKYSEKNVSIVQCTPAPTCDENTKPLANSTIGHFDRISDTDEAIIEINLSLKYLDLLQSANSNEFHFECKLCCKHLEHNCIMNHLLGSKCHLTNFTLSFYFENFLSLEKSTKRILRKLSYETDDKLKDFELLPVIDSENPQFKCKFCEVILFSDSVVNHSQSEEHRKCESETRIATNSRTSSQLSESNDNSDSGPIINETVDYFSPASVSVGIHSSLVSLNLHNVPKLSFESIGESTRGTPAETTLSSTKNTGNSKNNALDCISEPEISLNNSKTELNRNSSEVTEFVNDRAKKVVKDLTDKLKKYMNNFEPSYESGSNKVCYTCNICHLSFPSENARLHIYCDPHLINLRSSLSSAKSEALDVKNKQSLKKLNSQFHKQLYFFQLILDNSFNELYFACKVCTVVLVYDDVESHVSSSEHAQNLAANPIVLDFDSLNDCNKQIVEDLTAAVKSKLQDFTLVYRIGTEKLRFYCKCCKSVFLPQNVSEHIKKKNEEEAVSVENCESYDFLNESNPQRQTFEFGARNNATTPTSALKNMEITIPPTQIQHQNSTIGTFGPSTDTEKIIDSNLSLNYLDLLQTPNCNEFRFNCNLCCESLKPDQITNHIQAGYHLKNLTLNSYFEHFLSLERSTKKILRKLSCKINDKLKDFDLLPVIDSEHPQFKCKFCEEILFLESVVSHSQTEEHQKQLSENCTSANLRTSLQSYEWKKNVDSEPLIHKMVENFSPVAVSVGTLSSTALLEMPDKVANLNFEFVKDPIEGLPREKSSESALTKYFEDSKINTFNCETSLQTALNSSIGLKETHSPCNLAASSENSSESKTISFNSSNKEILNSLIDKIGMKINNFEFVLKSSSDELHFKCRFCSITMHPETVENHVNCEEHVECPLLSNTSSKFKS